MGKRKRKFRPKYILVIGIIILMNLMGVSYAYWTDSLQIDTKITTGAMNVEFIENETFKVVPEGNNDTEGWLSSEIRDKDGKKNNHLHISGILKIKEKGFIQFGIFNNSSVPVKYIGSNKEFKDYKFENGLKIRVNLQHRNIDVKGNIKPKNTNNLNGNDGNPKIQINTKDLEPREEPYEFSITLPFKIANGGDNGWKEELTITGSITIAFEEEPSTETEIEVEMNNVEEVDTKGMNGDESNNNNVELENESEETDQDMEKNSSDAEQDSQSTDNISTKDNDETDESGVDEGDTSE